MDSDKILVLEAGKIVEFRSPSDLRSDPTSAFARMRNKDTTGGDTGDIGGFLG